MANAADDELLDVLVIGGGQAGLAMAWHLASQDLRFVVLEAGPEPGHTWRSRWDSLTLFTPARYDALPGLPGLYFVGLSWRWGPRYRWRSVPRRGCIDSGGGRCDYPGLRTALRCWAFGAWRDHSYAGGAARTVRVTVPEGGSPWPYGSSCLHL